jgi:hypothetical protein
MSRVPKDAKADGTCQTLIHGQPCGEPTDELWHLRCREHFEEAAMAKWSDRCKPYLVSIPLDEAAGAEETRSAKRHACN